MNLADALAMGGGASDARSGESLPMPSMDKAVIGDGLAFGDLAVGLGLTVMHTEEDAEANDTPGLPPDGAVAAVVQAPENLVVVTPGTNAGGVVMALPSQCHEGLMDRRHVIGSLVARSSVPLASDLSPAAKKIEVAGFSGAVDQLDALVRSAQQNNAPMAAKATSVRVSPSMESALTMAGFAALSPTGEVAATLMATPQTSREVPANLAEALGERLQWLHLQGADRAVVNLRPHMAGHVQVEMTHEAGALAIRLTATQREVVQQLQTITESLRHELGARQFQGVSVQVAYAREQSSPGHGSAEQERPHEKSDARAPSRALDTPESDGQSFAMNLGGGSSARE